MTRMTQFKYLSLPNLDSYQNSIIDITSIPLNNDIQVLASLEYKGISDILILKGEYLEYEDTLWSIFTCGIGCCCPMKNLIRARAGYLVRIPISITSSTSIARNNEYKLSYQTWAVLNKPNFISKQSDFLYLGFEVSLEDYIHYSIIIEKGKKNIKDMLELF